MVAFLIIAALVLDVGYSYSTGRQEQTVGDLSALAAAAQLPGDPVGACDTSWAYTQANLPGLPSGASMPCASFPSSCDSTTVATTYTATSTGGYTITYRYPVPDSDALMSSQPIRQPADGDDPCARFGVTISHDDASFFSAVGGIGNLYPHVKAVARGGTGQKLNDDANLVSLDPTGCVGIEANGASNGQTTTEVVVDSYIPAPGQPAIPGAIAVDSDGATCGGGSTTIDAAGAANIFAEPTTGTEVGQISLFAMPGSATTCSGSTTHDCNPSQVPSNIAPQPVTSPARVTRAPADHVYNCKASYPLYDGVVRVAGCDTFDPKNGGPYIDQFTTAVQTDIFNNTPPDVSWQTFPTCSPSSGVYVGNWWVNCPSGQGFQLANTTHVTFKGNVIFNGNVNQSASSELDFEGNSSSSIPASCKPPTLGGSSGADASSCLDYSSYVPSSAAPALFTGANGNPQPSCTIGSTTGGYLSQYSPAPDCASFVYVNGSMTPSGSNYTLNFNGAFVYVTANSQNASTVTAAIANASNYVCASQSSANSLTSNGGTTNWIAPTDGLFNNLGLWSESGSGTNSPGHGSTASFGLHGGGSTTVDGVFFTPCAQFAISGGFTNPQTAQFLTFQLSVGGGSQLTMIPDPNRHLPTKPTGSMLIR